MQTKESVGHDKIDYGVDAPGVKRGLGAASGVALLVCIALTVLGKGNIAVSVMAAISGLAAVIFGFLFSCMLAYGLVGKERARSNAIAHCLARRRACA